MVADFYGVIHVMEEAQKMRLTNVWVDCDSALVCVVFTVMTNVLWMLRNRWNTSYLLWENQVYIFREGMCVLISWLIYNLFIENHFNGIIVFHLVCS